MSSSTPPLSTVPPGPRGWPFFGVLPRIWRDPLRFFTDVAREHGDVARIGLGKFTLYLVSSPDLVGHVLHDNEKNYWKGKGLAAAEIVMGQGLATNKGEEWERHHRLIQPVFASHQIEEYFPFLWEAVRALLEEWRQRSRRGEAFDAASDMRRLALQVTCHVLFRSELDPATHDAISRGVTVASEKINRSAWSLIRFLDSFPTPFNRRFRRALAELDATVYRRIAEQRASAGTHKGLLDQILGASDANGGIGLSERQIRDEIVTLFIAGVDTPAHALAWTIHLLSLHPDWAKRVADEADDLLGDKTPSMQDVERLVIAERVLKESMRLYPPAWVILRTPFEDDVLGGYSIPAGCAVLLSQYVVHRHPAHWEQPEVFDPERWTHERSASHHRFAYFPFGGGSRYCIAHGLAMLLGKFVIAMAAREFRWESARLRSRPVVPQPLTTLKPKHGIFIRAHERIRGQREEGHHAEITTRREE